jgi:membrane protein required for colicin V production
MAGEIILDIIVIGIILVSGLLALARGLVKEVFSMASWVGAVLVTVYAFTPVRPLVGDLISWPEAEIPATIAILFIGSLIIFSIAAHLISKILQKTGAGVIDRTLGFLFGLLRGVLITIVLFVVVGWYVGPKDQPQWFRNARTVPLIAATTEYLVSFAPEDMQKSLPKIVKPERRSDTSSGSKTARDNPTSYRSPDRHSLQRLIEGATQAK